jgi:hypothetical protein
VYRLSRTNTDSFPKSTQASGSGNVHMGFLRARHRLFGSQGCTKVLCRTRVSRTAQSPYTLRQSDRMEKEPPHGPPWPFYSHASGLTLVTLETACVPPARITFLGQELRIKNINGTCSFGIIIKYYSQA